MKRHLQARPGVIAAAALIAVACMTVGFVLVNLEKARSELGDTHLADLLFLVPAVFLMSGAVLMLGWTWAGVLTSLGSTSIQRSRLVRQFLVTWPARYVPGTLPYHVTRVLLAERAGSRKYTIAASVIYETVLGLASATIVGFSLTVASFGLAESVGSIYGLAILPLAILPLLLQPRIMAATTNRLLRMMGRPLLEQKDLLRPGQLLSFFLSYSTVHCLNGIAFYFVLQAILDSPVSPQMAVGTFSLAAAAGVAALLVPGGIGVREGVLVALLSGVMSPHDALVAAGLARAVSIIADVLPASLVVGLDLTWALWRRNRPPASSTFRT